MALSGPLRAVASKLITQFGQPATIRKVVTTPDPANDTVSEVITDYPVQAVIDDYAAYEVKGLIQERDKKVIIPASQLAIEPEAGMLFISESLTYRIVYSQRITSDTQGVVFMMTVRL